MHYLKRFLLFTFSFIIVSIEAQEKWNFELIVGENKFGPVNSILYLQRTKNAIVLRSTENADKRIFGNLKALVGRALKKSPKGGIFIRMDDGLSVPQPLGPDSLLGTFNLPMLGKSTFKGIAEDSLISGKLFNDGTEIATLKGRRVDENFKYDFRDLTQRILDTTKKHLFNGNFFKDRKWRRFENKLKKLSEEAVDDVDLFFGFNLNSNKLPFSHFNLLLTPVKQDVSLSEVNNPENVVWREINKETAYIDIKSFSGKANEMDSVFASVLQHNYKNLIIDLRENPGGGLYAGLAFGKYLCNKKINAGYFVTNRWFIDGNNINNIESLPASKAETTNGFINELKNSDGRKLVLQPGSKVYEGKTYVLTSHATASTCEPIVYALKKNKIATIVGEKTAGAMLAATLFRIKGSYQLYIPIADYYTPEKERLDQVGVEPDIKVSADKALDYVLEIINSKK